MFDLITGNPLESVRADVVELADAPDSKSGGGNPVRVRFSPSAPIKSIRYALPGTCVNSPNPDCAHFSKDRMDFTASVYISSTLFCISMVF